MDRMQAKTCEIKQNTYLFGCSAWQILTEMNYSLKIVEESTLKIKFH